MDTTTTNSGAIDADLGTARRARRSRRAHRTAAATTLAAGLVVLAGPSADAQLDDVPPWSACEFRGGGASIDLGPLLNPYHDPGPADRAILLGDFDVGTDCSAYDLPV